MPYQGDKEIALCTKQVHHPYPVGNQVQLAAFMVQLYCHTTLETRVTVLVHILVCISLYISLTGPRGFADDTGTPGSMSFAWSKLSTRPVTHHTGNPYPFN